MAYWLINLNWSFNIEIWQNCRKNGLAAIGWRRWTEDEIENLSSYQKAIGYFRRIQPGDVVVAFLKDRRLGGWGTVTKPFDEQIFEPQLAPNTEEADFGKVISVSWDEKHSPPIGQASRMLPEDVKGFTCLSTINPLSQDAFERIKKIIGDRSRWEPIAELSEEQNDDEYSDESAEEAWYSPVRESALRKMLAADLSQLEPGLVPFDSKTGAEEITVGAAGRIDLFCKDKNGNPVVVELKRDGSSDLVIAQLARYMGYVKINHLPKGKTVRGIIVAHEADERLRLAMAAIPNVELKLYNVKISLTSETDKK